ncbi:hypothetical protein Ciccas_006338, partial [Cichlidogyrus casuarinus]
MDQLFPNQAVSTSEMFSRLMASFQNGQIFQQRKEEQDWHLADSEDDPTKRWISFSSNEATSVISPSTTDTPPNSTVSEAADERNSPKNQAFPQKDQFTCPICRASLANYEEINAHLDLEMDKIKSLLENPGP